MSRRIADLLIKIGADSYEFQQKANQVEKGLGQLEKRLSSIGKSLSLKVTAPLTALGVVALQNADTQAKAETKVATALKSTGNAVGYNLDQLKAYADSLRAQRDANGGRLPAVSVPDHADPDPFAHEGLMKLVEAKIASLAGAPVQLGEYKLVNEFNVTKDYEVADAVSGAKFLVSFWSYGDIVSGWDVKKL